MEREKEADGRTEGMPESLIKRRYVVCMNQTTCSFAWLDVVTCISMCGGEKNLKSP